MGTTSTPDPTTEAIASAHPTTASAWVSSPLGDPAAGVRQPFDPGLPAPRIQQATKAPVATGAVVAAFLVAIGAGAALGMAILVYTSPGQPNPTVVVPGSGAGRITPGPPAAVPPAAGTPPDSGPASVPDSGPADAGGGLAPRPSWHLAARP